tara:strand:- start:4 stop:1164 length:1161 start_codon:yes stop_codon:yes gene_type:complete
MLDLFSGIGGFHKGFEQAGYEFEWVGFSEIDKYASAVYKHRFPNAKELGDISAIRPERDLPDHIDILCGGFPCQAFSQSGLRKGFKDTRGTLFFEIARLLRHYIDTGKPINHFVLENVKGLLSHDNGRTFAVIYGVLTDLGYTVECQLLNTKWVLPQNRERIYIVGHIGRGSRAKVFPITEDDKIYYNSSSRSKSKTEFCGAITTGEGHRRESNYIKVKVTTSKDQHKKILGYTRDAKGKVIKRSEQPHANTLHASTGHGGNTDQFVKIKEATKKGYAEAKVGDSINLSVPNSKTRRGRVGKGEAQTLDTGMQQYTLDKTKIRRLTPIECERLQGFPDQWTSQGNLDGKVVDISDTQRYKQCGNAVSVPIVQLVARSIYDNLRMDS